MLTRALIVLLLVLNLGVAAWWWLRPSPAAPPPPAQPAGVLVLRLVGEAAPTSAPASSPTPTPTSDPVQPSTQASEPAPTPAPESETAQQQPTAAVPADAPVEPADAPSAAPPQRCFAFGPYNDRADADAARTALQPQATRLTLRAEPAPARGRNWDVRLPPQADRAAAQAMAQRLEAAGFRDYYVIGEGEGANGIALGRFGSEQAARRHQAALQAAGFAAQIDGPPSAERFWLDVAAGPAFDAQAARRAAAAPRAQPAECAAAG